MVAISLVACRDFSSVRNLKDQADKIENQSKDIATDFFASCMRRARIPSNRFPSVTAGGRTGKEQECRKTAYPASESIQDANTVLVDYLNKLAKLAGNGSSVIKSDNREALESSLTGLPAALTSAGVVVPEPVTTIAQQGTPILEAIFNAIADEIRQDTIPPVMICTDPAIEQYTQGLEEIATVVYVNQLQAEAEQQAKYFTELTPRISGPDFPPSEALSSWELDEAYNAAIDSINAKKDFAENFAKVLQETRATHYSITLLFAQKLNLTQPSPATNPSNKEPEVEIIESRRQEFCSTYEANPHSSQSAVQLTPSEAEKVVNILKDYERATAPLLEKMDQVEFEPIEPSQVGADRSEAN
ncbi:hypothetical protein [Leptolyngbya ohadii]|uniref:hypothetical protein n=1 Tax=Leptolyngbya ohadii TaxID=1962290 RepID=UPI00117A3795|nr:hypothetical protein [Leptolyngbya ohadii]